MDSEPRRVDSVEQKHKAQSVAWATTRRARATASTFGRGISDPQFDSLKILAEGTQRGGVSAFGSPEADTTL